MILDNRSHDRQRLSQSVQSWEDDHGRELVVGSELLSEWATLVDLLSWWTGTAEEFRTGGPGGISPEIAEEFRMRLRRESPCWRHNSGALDAETVAHGKAFQPVLAMFWGFGLDLFPFGVSRLFLLPGYIR